ncbi:MAG: hypothetical protein IKU37_09390 [Candidatus Gastranaerophilales bacterium]|nr:hypothetical protein [Candidatus Gastranaerophilales bacterium]
MKKAFFLIVLIFLSITPLQALEEEFKPIILEPEERAQEEKISPYTKQALKGIIEKEYDLNSSAGMFKEQLTAQFNRGIIKNTTLHAHMIHTLNETIADGDKDFNYDSSLINVGLSGKFRSDKEKYTLLFDLTPDIFEDFSHRFLLDAHIETTRIKNHTILFGSSRPQVGYEGGNSAKTIPFLTRSQASRNFSNARKTGVKADGKYKWVDYEIGGFSSDIRYHEFFPGVEGNLWVDFKPLANVEEKYGKLYVGGGISHGERSSTDFTVASSAIRYNKEKFWARAEYQHADGSNGGSGLTDKKGYGYNLTLAYRLTKKLELLARFDDFDKDKSIKNNNSREYTAGINWYILGQTARIMLNYIFCENEAKSDSHRILLGTQIIL